jgi:urea carboxylase
LSIPQDEKELHFTHRLQGGVIHLGERECSTQRRHQKLVEESPAPGLTPQMRTEICAIAIRLCEHVKYESAGTVEFILDDETQDFYFLEVNTRLQVEHGVTEMCNPGVDIVEWMIRQVRLFWTVHYPFNYLSLFSQQP